MSSKFALYTVKIIKALPYWFKMKKNAKESIGASFLNITGLELDNMRYVLDYAYNQTKIQSADVEFIDTVYKTILPMNLSVAEIDSVISTSDALIKARNLAHFFGIDLDGVEYPEVYRNNMYFVDEKKNILYVRNPYDANDDEPYGSISFIIRGTKYTQPLMLHQVWNFFDEFGLLLDCPRIPGESNKEYKTRILDVFINPAGASTQGLLNGIARELDLRVVAVWEDGSRDYIIEDSMVVLNSICVDGIEYSEKDVFITADNTVLIPGDPLYKDESRTITYVRGVEMHQLHNRGDYKLYNELFNVDSSATDLLKYYTERIHSAAPIMWGHFKWNESYWDISDKELGGVAFIPNLYDAKIHGFTAYKKP